MAIVFLIMFIGFVGSAGYIGHTLGECIHNPTEDNRLSLFGAFCLLGLVLFIAFLVLCYGITLAMK